MGEPGRERGNAASAAHRLGPLGLIRWRLRRKPRAPLEGCSRGTGTWRRLKALPGHPLPGTPGPCSGGAHPGSRCPRAVAPAPCAARDNVPPAEPLHTQPFCEAFGREFARPLENVLDEGRAARTAGPTRVFSSRFGVVTRGLRGRRGEAAVRPAGVPREAGSPLSGACRKAPSLLALPGTTTQGPGCNYCYSSCRDSGTPEPENPLPAVVPGTSRPSSCAPPPAVPGGRSDPGSGVGVRTLAR